MCLFQAFRSGIVAALALAAAAAPAATEPGDYTKLYVFGDSLVDAGNIAALTGGRTPDSRLGYANGRFTNGYDYVDYLNYQLFGTPTTASLKGGDNFAFGGARVVKDTDAIPDLSAQLAAYAARGGTVDPDALFILNAGGNDIFALGRDAAGVTPSPLLPYASRADYIEAVVATYAGSVQYLNDIGARNILITGIPNATDPTAYEVDALLQMRLNGLTLNSQTTLFRYSYLDFFNRLQTDPGAFGLPALRTDKSCIELAAQASGCAGIFSFDGTHPTGAVQLALSRDIASQFGVAAVPEPATWIMLIGGFGLAGGAMRRRRAILAG